MQLRKTFTIGCLFVSAALAQTENGLRAKVATLHYPGLAELARVQGDVRLEVTSGEVTLLSGDPLLASVAVDNAKTFGLIQGQTMLDMTYHFVFVDTNFYNVPRLITVKKGNAVERAIFRVLGLPTEKEVHTIRCEQGVAPASDINIDSIKTDGAVIEIWVYGRTFCLETLAVVARFEARKTRFDGLPTMRQSRSQPSRELVE